MVQLADDLRLARLYLLGELPAEERSRFEDRYLGDPDLFARVEEAEAELLDEWAAGRLPPAQGARLEARFGESEAGRRRLAFARALKERAAAGAQAPGPHPERSLPGGFTRHRPARVALWAAGAVAAASLALLAWRELSPSPPFPPDGPPPVVASLRLSPGLARGAGAGAEVALPDGAGVLELRLDTPAAVAYRATVETAEGQRVWQGEGVASTLGSAAELVLRLPARELAPGDYVVTLLPATPEAPAQSAAEFFFRLESPERRERF